MTKMVNLKRKLAPLIMASIIASTLSGTVFAAPDVSVYVPITTRREVTFTAGEVDESVDGESHTEGTSNRENTTSSQNSRVSKESALKRSRLIDNSEMVGDLIIQGDTYVVNTYTMYMDTYDLNDYILSVIGYDTIPGLLPVQKFRMNEIINPDIEPDEEIEEDPLEGDASLGMAGYDRDPDILTDDPNGLLRITDNIGQALNKILTRAIDGGSGTLRKAGTPEPNIVTSGPTGTPPGALGPFLPGLEGNIDDITEELEIALKSAPEYDWEYWSEDLLLEWQLPIVEITGGEIIVNKDAIGLDYERTDIIPGGIIDTRTLESRFKLIDLYLNHISTSSKINTRVISEYRITGETQSKIVEKNPTDNWIWRIEDESGNLISGPIYTQSRYLRFIFGSAGTYRIRAWQVMDVLRADVVSYDKNEYWVLNNGDAFDGMVIYRDRKTGMKYNTNVIQEPEEVPVSDIWQIVTEDMVGFAFIAGPGNGLVGVRPEFNTQRYS
jgi:hypothetical protein